ncbi:MAG: hypothetical protein QM655_05525 [Nocardioidaceae bacterium]
MAARGNDKTDDDLSVWRDEPLVRALRAPGTSAELVGEQEIVTAYRRAMPRRGFGRVVGRLGVGGTTIVTTIALSSGVAAAAFTQSLPDPVQSIAHDVLGPIGVPAAPHRAKPAAQPPVSSGPASSASPSPSSSATPDATGTPASPDGARRAGASGSSKASPGANPTPTASASPGSGPSATPTTGSSTGPSAGPTTGPTTEPITGRRVPAAVSVATSAARVLPGEGVTVTGVVTSNDGTTLGNRAVRLKLRVPGTSGWVVVSQGRTDTDGSYSLTSPGLTKTSILRVVAGHKKTRSEPVRVVVEASLSATWSNGLVSITSAGAQPGDTVTVLRRQGGRLVKTDQVALDRDGTALLPAQQRRKAYKLWLRLPATKLHGKAVVVVQVPAR